MNNWFKKIELENHDVLLERVSTDEDGEAIRMSVRLGGALVKATLGFEDDNQGADDAFANFQTSDAESFVTEMVKMVGNDPVDQS